jgi:CheY-like chemotaxis protein
MSKLVVINRTLSTMAHELGQKWVTIGRHDGNSFQIPEISVSGRHCEVLLNGENLIVRDLQSTNGTFVDGKKIIESVVQTGQVLRLGEVELKLEVSASAEPAAPAESSSPGFSSKKLLTTTGARPVTAATPSEKAASVESVTAAIPPVNGEIGGKKNQVLFVDDSLAFLETFTELCSTLSNQAWEIHTAASADRALAILHQHPIDLVVLDIGMPMVDGLQLLGIINRRYSGVKIVVLTARASESNRATCLAGGAELFIEKSVAPEGAKMVFNMLNDMLSWAHRDGFSGALRQVGLPEVIQMECNGRHSSILEIRNQQLLGQIYIEAGVITHAVAGTQVGEKAFNKLLSLRGGQFYLKPFKAPPQRTVQAGWEVLLLEAARCNDEETSWLTRKSTEEAARSVAPPMPPTEETHAVVGDDIVVVATYDGKWHRPDEANK